MINLQKNETELTNEMMSKINLSKDKVNLEKHVVNLSKCMVNLSKKNDVDLGAVKARVVVVMDYSYSMSELYNRGIVQDTLKRLVPLGLTFDDNGSIDVYLFQSDYRKMEDMNINNYDDYVSSVIRRSGYNMGGTNYAPVLNAIIYGGETTTTTIKKKGLFGLRKEAATQREQIDSLVDNNQPTFILFITDGDNSDKPETDKIIKKCSSENVFIQFIGIGNDSFKYLKSLDDMEGRERDNTGFSNIKKLDKTDDTELFNTVLGEFANWLKGNQ